VRVRVRVPEPLGAAAPRLDPRAAARALVAGSARVPTRAPAETMAVAEALVELLRPGDVVILAGGIGSGKTVFAKGVARALDVREDVVSPSFTLHNVYEGRLTLNHFDFYRLETAREAFELALDETADEALTLVEWGERFPEAIAPPYLEVRLELGEAEDDRWLSGRAVGAGWDER
jgi:tRNA threonylcarbamoyladenosine biosynthesis protein TsaE